MTEKTVMTTAAGCPVADNQNSQTAGARGPVLMQDHQLLEKRGFYHHLYMSQFKGQAI